MNKIKKLEGIKGWLLIYLIIILFYGVVSMVLGLTEIPGALTNIASERLSYNSNSDYKLHIPLGIRESAFESSRFCK